MDARIRIVAGPLTGQTIELFPGNLLIGREEDCDVRPPCQFASRHHCALSLDHFTLRIRDLGSKNGTYLNGRRIAASDVIVLHEDVISVGETIFVVEMVQEHQESTSQVQTRSAELKTPTMGAKPRMLWSLYSRN